MTYIKFKWINVTLSRYVLQEDYGIRKRDFLWNEKYIYIYTQKFLILTEEIYNILWVVTKYLTTYVIYIKIF